jgi:two-component system cell cycle sensor histidine kinase/response regulator CckA
MRPHTAGSQPSAAAPLRQTILLVDDDSSIRALFSTTLEHYGFVVLKAKDGHEALTICKTHEAPIDLLLADLMLPCGIRFADSKRSKPSLHGIDLMRHVSQLRPDIHVLLFSGQSDKFIKSLGNIPEGTAFLRKPFSLDTLVRAVRLALETPTTH